MHQTRRSRRIHATGSRSGSVGVALVAPEAAGLADKGITLVEAVMAIYPRWGGPSGEKYPWMSEETARWHIARKDVLGGGRWLKSSTGGWEYVGGRSIVDPDYRVSSPDEIFFCPIELLSDSI